MSLPIKLYTDFQIICECDLIKKRVFDEHNIKEFETLLNKSQPSSNEEIAQRKFIMCMYNSNNQAFLEYIQNNRSKVRAIVVWLEARRILQYFSLSDKISLSYDTNGKFVASIYINKPRPYNKGKYNSNRSYTK